MKGIAVKFIRGMAIIAVFLLLSEIIIRYAAPDAGSRAKKSAVHWLRKDIFWKSDSEAGFYEMIGNNRFRLDKINYSVNSFGLRNKEIPLEKPDNTFRILLMGDSVTFGYGLAFEKNTFARVLQARLNSRRSVNEIAYGVINAGVLGYNLKNYLSFFELKGRKLNPDLVVVNFSPEDCVQTVLSDGEETKYYRMVQNDWYPFPVLISPRGNLGNWLIKEFAVFRVFNAVLAGYLPPESRQHYFKSDNICFDNFSKLHKKIEETGAGMVVVGHSFLGQTDWKQLKNNAVLKRQRDVMNRVKESTGSPLIEMLPWYEKCDCSPESLALDDIHPNKAGHRIIADALFDYLKVNKFIL